MKERERQREKEIENEGKKKERKKEGSKKRNKERKKERKKENYSIHSFLLIQFSILIVQNRQTEMNDWCFWKCIKHEKYALLLK